jgi:hypothetical protein
MDQNEHQHLDNMDQDVVDREHHEEEANNPG